MKALILKVPTVVFLIFIFTPIVLLNIKMELGVFDAFLRSFILPTIVSFIWLVSLIDYMSTEARSKKYVTWVYILILIRFSASIYLTTFDYSFDELNFILLIELFLLILGITTAILSLKIVKQVFYARSNWFLFIELWVLPIGIFTLTPDVKNWEEGEKHISDDDSDDVLDSVI